MKFVFEIRCSLKGQMLLQPSLIDYLFRDFIGCAVQLIIIPECL